MIAWIVTKLCLHSMRIFRSVFIKAKYTLLYVYLLLTIYIMLAILLIYWGKSESDCKLELLYWNRDVSVVSKPWHFSVTVLIPSPSLLSSSLPSFPLSVLRIEFRISNARPAFYHRSIYPTFLFTCYFETRSHYSLGFAIFQHRDPKKLGLQPCAFRPGKIFWKTM